MLSKSLYALIGITIATSIAVTNNSLAADGMAKSTQFWWPERLNLEPLRSQDPRSNPYGDNFDYATAFESIDLQSLKSDIEDTLTQSQDWWPADWGHYGGLMIRLAWHTAGTYRIHDGRGGADGGQHRFEPLNSWPDNANLDKARRLLWPVKQKYGRSLSWADLMVLVGNVALESMGFETLGFSGGRADEWEADLVYWGPETEMLASDKRYDKNGKLIKPMGAVQMGLIYVNPQGPMGNNDPLAAAEHMRESFGRMAMNDEEIVALVAGGHTLGKAHGAHSGSCVGAEPAGASIEEQGLGWKNKCGTGKGADTMTSGLEGAWTSTPTKWSILYLENLFRFDWKQTKSPAGATQWIPTDESASALVPDAHDPKLRHAPIMFTTDIALRKDPGFREISSRFLENPKEFDLAFAKAWFKLTHRDLGPSSRYIGDEIPAEEFIWQDPIPSVDHRLISARDSEKLKKQILESELTISELVKTAWASASTFRDSDMRGGANGARIQLEPQINWQVNDPEELARVIKILKGINSDFNESLYGDKKISLADTIILGGAAAIEKAASNAGIALSVPFTPGRTDALQAMTDIESFAVLEPTADAFRNYYSRESYGSPADMLVEKADLLNLSIPEMTALIGGLRVLDANTNGSKHGVFTETPGSLDNDFFTNLLDMSVQWTKSKEYSGIYEGRDRKTNALKWTATPVDLIFGSNSELRAIAEVYASSDGKEKLAKDFVLAWNKVMMLDRFDL